MYRLEVLQVERKVRKQECKKQVDARRHDWKDKTQTPKKKREKRGEEKQTATRLRYAPREEREIKEIDMTHPHQGPP
jgi:hypothetical protein